MEANESKVSNFEKLEKLQKSFDASMKILERHIAESITNKEKLEAIKKDLREANKKFIETEKCLDELKTDLEKTIIK